MELLRERLVGLVRALPDWPAIQRDLAARPCVFPFNDFEYLAVTAVSRGLLTLEQYRELRADYLSRNRYLPIFEISGPRTFGEAWAQEHLRSIVPELIKPTRTEDPGFSGEYDFWLDGQVRIEVKASRAVDSGSSAPLYMKALSSDSSRPFWMNFQQVKPRCCDVFVWIGVWRDVIRYWVLSSRELETHPCFSAGQHRGNVGEGQLHLRDRNIAEFSRFEVSTTELLAALRAAYDRQVPRRAAGASNRR